KRVRRFHLWRLLSCRNRFPSCRDTTARLAGLSVSPLSPMMFLSLASCRRRLVLRLELGLLSALVSFSSCRRFFASVLALRSVVWRGAGRRISAAAAARKREAALQLPGRTP